MHACQHGIIHVHYLYEGYLSVYTFKFELCAFGVEVYECISVPICITTLQFSTIIICQYSHNKLITLLHVHALHITIRAHGHA